jgi:hypothetical protein
LSIFVQLCVLLLSVLHALPVTAEERPVPLTCTYEVLTWNVDQKRSIETKTIRHPYRELAREEVDPLTGCTVCSEDQTRIEVPPFPAFSVCSRVASRVQVAFRELKQNGAPIFTVIGYHVIKSRGKIDSKGNRTGFSNHSFGTAIDINPEQNGLYDRCIQFGPACRLIRGGERRINVPGTLELHDEVVTTLKREGFRWGGEIEGDQKDFMHFSITGY